MRKALFLCWFSSLLITLLLVSETMAKSKYPEYKQSTYDQIENQDLKNLYQMLTHKGHIKLGDPQEKVDEILGEPIIARKLGKMDISLYCRGYRIGYRGDKVVFISYWNQLDQNRYGLLRISDLTKQIGRVDDQDQGGVFYLNMTTAIKIFGVKGGFAGYMMGSMGQIKLEKINMQSYELFQDEILEEWDRNNRILQQGYEAIN